MKKHFLIERRRWGYQNVKYKPFKRRENNIWKEYKYDLIFKN